MCTDYISRAVIPRHHKWPWLKLGWWVFWCPRSWEQGERSHFGSKCSAWSSVIIECREKSESTTNARQWLQAQFAEPWFTGCESAKEASSDNRCWRCSTSNLQQTPGNEQLLDDHVGYSSKTWGKSLNGANFPCVHRSSRQLLSLSLSLSLSLFVWNNVLPPPPLQHKATDVLDKTFLTTGPSLTSGPKRFIKNNAYGGFVLQWGGGGGVETSFKTVCLLLSSETGSAVLGNQYLYSLSVCLSV